MSRNPPRTGRLSFACHPIGPDDDVSFGEQNSNPFELQIQRQLDRITDGRNRVTFPRQRERFLHQTEQLLGEFTGVKPGVASVVAVVVVVVVVVVVLFVVVVVVVVVVVEAVGA